MNDKTINKREFTKMDLIHFLYMLTGIGITITIPVGLVIWNRLAHSGRWKNSQEAMNDQMFWKEFCDESQMLSDMFPQKQQVP